MLRYEPGGLVQRVPFAVLLLADRAGTFYGRRVLDHDTDVTDAHRPEFGQLPLGVSPDYLRVSDQLRPVLADPVHFFGDVLGDLLRVQPLCQPVGQLPLYPLCHRIGDTLQLGEHPGGQNVHSFL